MRDDGSLRPPSGSHWRWSGRAGQALRPVPPRSRRRRSLAFVLVCLLAGLLALPASLVGALTPAPTLALALTTDAPTVAADPASRHMRPPPGPATPALVAPARLVPPLRPPIAGPLVRGYEALAGPFGPGHRGVDFGSAPGAPVWAPAPGRIAFAGRVAGMAWVSIEVAPGVLVTLGPLRALAVGGGRRVGAGARLADLAPGHAAAGHPTTLHLGLRIDGEYVDPLPWLTGLGQPRLAALLEPGGPH